LFTVEDVGKSKSKTAHERLQQHVVSSKTVLESHHFDVLPNWQKIIEFAKESTVVFNMIDVGDFFDAAVQSLCMRLNKLFIQGGTFCQ